MKGRKVGRAQDGNGSNDVKEEWSKESTGRTDVGKKREKRKTRKNERKEETNDGRSRHAKEEKDGLGKTKRRRRRNKA